MFLYPAFGSFLIGWAKPVPVTRENFLHPRRDDILVSVAGPAANLLLFTIALGCLCLLTRLGIFDQGAQAIVLEFLTFFLLLNFFLAVFNMLPIPPLDGSWVMKALLPGRLSYEYSRLDRYGFILIYVLLVTGLLKVFFTPAYMLLGGILKAVGLGEGS